jgi:hypothetical protein
MQLQMSTNVIVKVLALAVCGVCATGIARARAEHATQARITVDWAHPSGTLQTVPTLQVVTNPWLRPQSPIHDSSFAALRNLHADYVRFVPWFPYPRLAVAELQPPRDGSTSWDFSLIDPIMADFFAATNGHPTILNFSTEPAWMFRRAKPRGYPLNPDKVSWEYSSDPAGQLIDPTGHELAEYEARIVSWFAQGGFTDEYGHYHKSGYHFQVPYWEVLNEPDGEHGFSAAQYSTVYDAIVAAIRKVSPKTRFVGLALADPDAPAYASYFEYFLNPRNHRPGTPLDMISLHFYAAPGPTESLDQWQYTFFTQAAAFVARVRFIDLIRQRLSPSTQIIADEVGSILPADNALPRPAPIPRAYWNLSGALYAYVYIKLAELGIATVNESQLVGYPLNFPEVSLIDWKTGMPDARYWVLKLLCDQMNIGDRTYDADVADASSDAFGSGVVAQGYRSAHRARKILIINTRNSPARLTFNSNVDGARVEVVDESTGERPPQVWRLDSPRLILQPFAVDVVTLP